MQTNHYDGSCPCHKIDDQLQGFGSNAFSLADAISNPKAVIDQYKTQALYGVLIFAGTLATLNYIMLHQALNQKIKKFRK